MKSPRRTFLKKGALLVAGGRAALAAPFAAAVACSSPPSEPIATTTYGKLRGRTEDGVHVFRGVPYGANTTGTISRRE